MAVSLSIHLKQTQRLAMTQSLRQSIEMLQLSTIELAETVAQELETNPVLEEELSQQEEMAAYPDGLINDISLELSGNKSHRDELDSRDLAYADASDAGFHKSYDDDRKQQAIENAFTETESLTEHLSEQLRELPFSDSEQANLMILATLVNDDGFLTEKDREYCLQSGMTGTEYEAACETLSRLDPIGCGAPSVRESLLLQAKCVYPDDHLLQTIIRDHFEDLSKLFYDRIAKCLGISIEEVTVKNALIQTLSPYPGRKYTRSRTNYVIPELEVSLVGDEIILMFYDDWVPRVAINSYYTNMLTDKSVDRDIRRYVREKVNSAKYLIRSISGRRETIERVVRAIMEEQRDFLRMGPGNLKPLVHADIAQATGFNESTISRVTSNKYVQTPFGVFELKYFFVSRIAGNEGDESSDRVMKLMRDILANEKPDSPYTDDEIVRRLNNVGIQAARRTIAKYRGILGIPSSNKRKRINKLKME